MQVKLVAASIILGISAFIHADSQTFGGQWKGLNNSDASIMIGDNEAQDLLNVDITDNGSGIRKRPGYSQFKTIGTSTWGVRGGYYYTDTSGSKYLIHANNRSVYKSQNSGAYSAFITTDTAGTFYDFTDSQGYLYRATSDRDQFCRYDGATLTYYPSNPLGDQIEAMPDRLVMSGVAAFPNRVYFSGAADFTTFTTGLNDTDPFYEEFGLPGQKITAIKYALGRLFAWTGTTLSYWAGSTQFDGTIQDVSINVGTTQPGSILYDNGIIFWQGNDKHFYSYDGNNIDKISTPISGSVSGFVGGESKLAIQTTQSDFQLGTTGSGLSLTYSPGFIYYNPFEMSTLIDDFSDGNITSNPAWNTSLKDASTTIGYSAGQLSISNNVGFAGKAYTTISTGRNITVKFDLNGGSNSNYSIGICTATPVSLASASGCYSGLISNYNSYFRILKDNAVLVTAGDALPSPASITNFELRISTVGLLSIYRASSLITSFTDTTYSTFTYIFIKSGNGNVVETSYWDNIYINYLSDLYSTTTFISSAFNIGTGITSWGSFSDNSTKTGNAALAYTIYTDTNTSIDTNNATTFVSSQTITPPAIPTISTAPYLVWKTTFTRTASTETASIDSVSISWNEGTLTHTFGSVDKNHRLIWSLAENNSTTNNATYIYDQRFQSWLKYSFAMDAPARVGETTYFGGPSTGVVYYFPSANSDNGSSITSYWKSKDFIGSDPSVEKDYQTYSIVAKTQTGSSIAFEYAINGSPTTTSRTVLLTSSSGLPFIRNNGRIGNGTIGNFINFKIGNVGADLPFEVYSVKYDYMPRAWRVMQ